MMNVTDGVCFSGVFWATRRVIVYNYTSRRLFARRPLFAATMGRKKPPAPGNAFRAQLQP